MDAKIELDNTWIQCLIDNAGRRTKAYEALIYHTHVLAVPPYGDAVVSCDAETAEEILQLAKAHCPEAMRAVERALRDTKNCEWDR